MNYPACLPTKKSTLKTKTRLVDYTNKIASLSELDLAEVADKYFQDKNYSTAILTPKK